MSKENYWGELAQKSNKRAITSPDINVDVLEKESIKKYLKKGDLVMDLGSGDGLATIEFAQKVKHIEAIEPSPTLIKLAQKNQKRAKQTNIHWIQASALEIDQLYPQNKFDCIIAKRCLLNLKSWEKQKKALKQIASLIKKGGYLLLTDGFNEGLANLNRLRTKFGLKAIPPAKYNLYFDRDKFKSFVKKYFTIVEENNFGIYYFLSHFFNPLLIKPKEPHHRSKINQIATQIALKEKLLEDYGYCNFYALKKR